MNHVLAVFGSDIVHCSACLSALQCFLQPGVHTHKHTDSHRRCEQQRATATVNGDTAALPTLSYYLICSSAQGYICQSVLEGLKRHLLSGEMKQTKKIMTKKHIPSIMPTGYLMSAIFWFECMTWVICVYVQWQRNNIYIFTLKGTCHTNSLLHRRTDLNKNYRNHFAQIAQCSEHKIHSCIHIHISVASHFRLLHCILGLHAL